MNPRKYLEEMKKIQENLFDYLENMDENASLKDIFKDNRYHDDRYELISLLYFVLKISNDHHRSVNFYDKIEKILQLFKEDIKTKIPNSELFQIFHSNKKILLFLHQEGIFTFDEQIVKKIIKGKYIVSNYPEYFSPEIRPFINEKWFKKYLRENDWITKELPDDFNERRKKGENDNFICELIQKDSIDDFDSYVTRKQYPLNSMIKPSIYETNSFLLKNKQKISLIEYAVFFGSIQIFNHLRLNKVELTPSLWLYAIHGNNPDIIHILEYNKVKPEDESYKECFKESIKCHHNDIANYILDQFLLEERDNSNVILVNILKYYNLHFGKIDLIDKTSFNYLCKFDYYTLVNILLLRDDTDINSKTIYRKKINTIFI